MHARSLSLALATLLAGLATATIPGPAAAVEAPAEAGADAVPVAIAALDRLDAGDWSGVVDLFTAQMAQAAPAAMLEQVWTSLPQQLGAATGRGEPQVQTAQGMQMVVVPLHYERGGAIAQIAVDADGAIAGFFVKPASPPPPAASAGDDVVESGFTVGTGERALPGTLAMPADAAGPVPAVVLVHGSGPQDRDETVGANRPFLDIARGLAERGIAVLRYDKRTQARPQDFAGGDFDVDDETTDDAVAAVAALRDAEGIDPARVFVLGHSQGGMLAPRIAAQSGEVAGLVMLAAPARPLLDLLPEQNRYILGADGEIAPAEQDFLDELEAKIAKVRSGEPMDAADTPLGLPVRYWRHFDAIDPVADARSIDIPLLLLQGGRDFQVVNADWELWRASLADRPGTTFEHYPALNHLGIAGKGRGSLEEYNTPGHVAPQLIDDVAEWIKAQ